MTRRYADGTAVPVARSRGEIDKLLREWGADGIQWSDDFKRDLVQLRFLWTSGERQYLARFAVQLPTAEELEPQARDGRNGRVSKPRLDKLMADRGKQEHRLLLLWLKAALNAVAAGIVSAETIFLPFFEDADGSTVAEVALPKLAGLLTGGAARLLGAGR